MKKERMYLPVMVVLVIVVIGIFLWILLKDWHEQADRTPPGSRRARNGSSGRMS